MKEAMENLLLPFQAFCMLQRSGGSDGGGGHGHGVYGRSTTILVAKAVVRVKEGGLSDVGSTFVQEGSDAVAIQSRGTVLEGLHGRRWRILREGNLAGGSITQRKRREEPREKVRITETETERGERQGESITQMNRK